MIKEEIHTLCEVFGARLGNSFRSIAVCSWAFFILRNVTKNFIHPSVFNFPLPRTKLQLLANWMHCTGEKCNTLHNKTKELSHLINNSEKKKELGNHWYNMSPWHCDE